MNKEEIKKMAEKVCDWDLFWENAKTIPEERKKIESKYLKTTEVAKLIRKELKENYPNVKFSVVSDSYSGGSSINVHWINGPSIDLINKIIKKFEGARFDGMIDLKEYKGPILYKGEWVSFGVDYVFAGRKYSDDVFIRITNEICKKWGVSNHFNDKNSIFSSNVKIGDDYLKDYVYQELYKKNF